MGLFNFLKKKEKEINENKKIIFEELEEYISKEQKVSKTKESEFFETVNEIVAKYSQEVKQKVEILEAINIDSKKIEEHAKIIVKQSVEKYNIEVKKLLIEIKNYKKDTIRDFINHINNIFKNFNKRSAIFYGRSNYIIGDELLEVKNSLQKIHEEFSTLINSRKKIIEKSDILKNIKSLQNSIEDVVNKKRKVIEEIEEIDISIKKKEKIINETNSQIKKLQKSKEYLSFKKSIEDIKEKEKINNKLIFKCKNLINFKELMGLYYSSESKKEIVKKYKDFFSIQFSKTNAKELLNLIIDSKITNREAILQIAKNIENKKEEITKEKNNLDSDPLEKQNKIKSQYIQDIKKLEENKTHERKIKFTFEKEIIKEKIIIKEKLATLNIEIIKK